MVLHSLDAPKTLIFIVVVCPIGAKWTGARLVVETDLILNTRVLFVCLLNNAVDELIGVCDRCRFVIGGIYVNGLVVDAVALRLQAVWGFKVPIPIHLKVV